MNRPRPVSDRVHPRMAFRSGFPAALLAPLALLTALGLSPRDSSGQESSGVPPILFASRRFPEKFSEVRRDPVDRALIGKLLVREPDGEIRTLIDASLPESPAGTPADVMDPDVSWDGQSIVFSGYSTAELAWRIFEIRADGTGLHQVTASDRQADLSRYGEAAVNLERYDDLDPCYLPDGRICFVSTRFPESAPDARLRATNLYVVGSGGDGLRRITSERFGADAPAVDPTTGRVVFSRWWRTTEVRTSTAALPVPSIPPQNPMEPPATEPPPPPAPPVYYGPAVPPQPPPPVPDPTFANPNPYSAVPLRGVSDEAFPGVNTWFLASINPDGTGLEMFSGFHLDRTATQAYRPAVLPNGEALGMFLTEAPLLGRPGRFGLRRFKPGPNMPAIIGGPRPFFAGAPASGFNYHSAVPLPDRRILSTGSLQASGGAAEYDVFIQESETRAPRLFFGEPGIAELDAVPLVQRARPPAAGAAVLDEVPEDPPGSLKEAVETGRTFTFQVDNIFANAPVDVPIPNAPPMGTPLAIEFYMAPQRTTFPGADAPLLIKRVDIPASGGITVELPAGVPLFEVLRRLDGDIAVGRDGQVFHVGGLNYGKAGGMGRCVGCHAGHSMMPIADDPAWTNIATSAIVRASSFREETVAVSDGATQRSRTVAFRPEFLVDRRTDFFRSEWQAALGDRRPWITLSWGAPVKAREIILHGVRSGRGVVGARSLAVEGLSVETFLEGFPGPRETAVFTGEVTPEGVAVALDPDLEIDSIRVTITEFTGRHEGLSSPALAEIQVRARAVEGAAPAAAFLRGDSNCDLAADLSDAVTSLEALFLGKGPLCCQAAADANDDGRLDITDPIYLMSHLFLGDAPPPHPFPACGRVHGAVLLCDIEVCR